MGTKAQYVEATLDGYYNGRRRVGHKFWIKDGKKDFSKRWMKEAEVTADDPEPVSEADVADAAERIAAAEKERDDAKQAAVEAQEAAKAAEKERDELKAALDKATKPAAASKPATAGGPSGSGAA